MPTETRIYHGEMNPSDIARDIIAQFNRGNYRVQQIGRDPKIAVQIATREFAQSGGQTALTVTLHKVADGVSVQVGNQAWMGIAASLGVTALSALRNPLSLLDRIDDLAQDIESLQLDDEIWDVIEYSARQHGVGKVLSERLQRYICPYCNTPNKPGDNRCLACGAPLGDIQPQTCLNCGFIVRNLERECPNCHAILPPK
ncbi:MAG: zinc ribbon domain-containing protein [Anaerolineaceae bacterium]|nr:zinc ribbon domain-containing protein [Anaerolineaceae bacterium]